MAFVTENSPPARVSKPTTNQPTVDKPAIAAAFSRAAGSYDIAADLQRETGEVLLALGGNIRGCQYWMRVVVLGISAAFGASAVSRLLHWIWLRACWITPANIKLPMTTFLAILRIFRSQINQLISVLAI